MGKREYYWVTRHEQYSSLCCWVDREWRWRHLDRVHWWRPFSLPMLSMPLYHIRCYYNVRPLRWREKKLAREYTFAMNEPNSRFTMIELMTLNDVSLPWTPFVRSFTPSHSPSSFCLLHTLGQRRRRKEEALICRSIQYYYKQTNSHPPPHRLVWIGGQIYIIYIYIIRNVVG